jgi:hypothetical protein
MVKNETGAVFGRLTVKCQMPSQGGKASWLCRCTCGGCVITTGDALRTGKVKSCGCLRASGDHTRQHGHGSYAKGVSKTYKSWQEMRARCTNPKHVSYPNYGGRGIGCDPAWDSFDQFLADMGERPKGLSLDRKDGELGYSASNCQWSTRAVQNNNRRNVKLIEHLGRSQSLAEWCRELNIPYSRTYVRMNTQGRSFESAIL